MCGEYKTGKDRCDEALEQCRRIAEAKLEPLYQAIKDLKPRKTNRSDRAIKQLNRIANESLRNLDELLNKK